MRQFTLMFAAFAMLATGGAMAAKEKKPSKEEIKIGEAQVLVDAKKYTEANVIFGELCKKNIPAACQRVSYYKGVMAFEAKNYGEAATAFGTACKDGLVEACENAKIATKNQQIITQTAPEDLEKQRRAAAFEAALGQYKAKQYDQAAGSFNTLCKEGLQSGCQNEAAVLVEQSVEALKAVKRPNGQDCSEAVVASDYCRPPMVKAIELLGKICPTTGTNQAVISACARRTQLQAYVAATDKRTGAN